MRRHSYFLFFCAAWLALFYGSLRELVLLALRSELYSHTLLIPLVSGYLMYDRRKEIFADTGRSYGIGGPVAAAGILLYFAGRNLGTALSRNDHISLMVFSSVLSLAGGFILFYGKRAFRSAAFPFFFLAFMIPVPAVIMDKIILFLQSGSTDATYAAFKLLGIPVARDGFVFTLPGISIEVAKECSGIRSSIALFIMGILASALFLDSPWKRAVLVLTIVPLAVIKNTIRIVTLSLLGLYVDEAFVGGSDLHRNGGFVFFLTTVALFMLILWVLRKSERKAKDNP